MLNTLVMTKIIIHKPANEVFEAIVSPDKIGNFWFSSSSERWEKDKRILLRYEEYNAKGVITVLEMENNQKIEFSWGEEHGEGTVVTITLTELGLGTVIEVRESGLNEEDPDVVAKMMQQKEGWVYTLTCLKAYVESGINNLRASLVH
ncbi:MULTISPECIES: SRPBCC domain-containing protein [Lysinibacillus]|uniref:SRPBCC domain-containing protein n=1 Tax=Lysinibacillus TaxID=400634 RepID=UPI00257A8EE5|nr:MULTISPECIES: SRPBCC domain-containing protein [Lysinibacillus]